MSTAIVLRTILRMILRKVSCPNFHDAQRCRAEFTHAMQRAWFSCFCAMLCSIRPVSHALYIP